MEYLHGAREEEAVGYMNKAAKAALKALCENAQCGTVIVFEGGVIGEGYNAPPLDNAKHQMCKAPRGSGKKNYDQTCCMHAEWRAILDALKRNPEKVKGSKLYFVRIANGVVKKSGKPYCTVCSRLALDVGIEKFLLWHAEGIGEYDTAEYNKLSYEYKEEKA